MDRKQPIPPTQPTSSIIHGNATDPTTHGTASDRAAVTEHATTDAHGAPGSSRVERAMREVSISDEPIGRAAADQLDTGGKRLRADLTVEAARAAGPEAETVSEETTWAAAAVELIHQASLVHDDLMDRDPERRGHPAAWQNLGADGAILLGDHLIAAAFEAAARAPQAPQLVRHLAAAVKGAVGGQAREVAPASASDAADAVAAYEARVREKSGRLMALPVAAGLLTGGAEKATVEAAQRAWTALGAAYQVGDDLAELEGHKSGRTRQSDLIQRRLSAPVAHYLAGAGPGDWCNLEAFLAQPPADDELVAYWHRQLLASDAPARCRRHADTLITAARSEAGELPSALRDLLEATIQRIRPDTPSPEADAS